MPAGAVNQTSGVLNGRWRLGRRILSTRTPAETIANASSVPIETSEPASRTVRKPAGMATKTPTRIWVIHGGRNFGCTRAMNGGRSPSLDIEKKTRSEEHTSELQSRLHLVCRLLLEKKKDT